MITPGIRILNQSTASVIIACLCGLFFVKSIPAKTNCIISAPDSSYQPDGPYTVIRDSITSKRDPDDPIMYIFRPAETKDKSPVIILCHPFGNRTPGNYYELIKHLVSKGNVVFYPSSFVTTVRNNQSDEFRVSLGSIELAMQEAQPYIDTSRIGFVGHGTGGGSVPALARKCSIDKEWGKNGLFLYIISPWYMHSIDKREIATFPDSANMILQVFESDYINDPKIALDIFDRLSIAPHRKRFYIMYDDKNDNCKLRTSFSIPEGSIVSSDYNEYVNSYGIYRIVDALAEYTFYKNQDAYDFAFGKPGTHDCPIGFWPDGKAVRPMMVTDSPYVSLIDRNLYVNPWRSVRNPQLERSAFRTARKFIHNYRKKTLRSMASFLKFKIKNRNVDMINLDSLENPIVNDFGSDGPYSMQTDSVYFPNVSNDITSNKLPVCFFTPAGLRTPTPVIIFIRGYIGQNPEEFQPFIKHIVSNGYTVIYPTYPFLPKVDEFDKIMDKYQYIYAGIAKAARILSWRIDTTRVGFFGQSFGAGTVPAVAYKTLYEKGWGKNGAFMFITAPWYSYDITPEQFKQFPPDTKLLMQIYNDDRINDHAMAIDLFNAFPIAKSEKEFMTVYSDSADGYEMQANHFVPYGPKNIYGDLNLLDYYGIFRMFDALAEYTFTGNPKAKRTALGNESTNQVYMGNWTKDKPFHPAIMTDTPKAMHPELQYLYGWSNTINPRLQK